MQRILSRGEIEQLDRTRVPTLYPPQKEQVFARRAERMRALAEHSTIRSYLLLMAHVADAQQALLLQPYSIAAPTKQPSLGQLCMQPRDPIWRTLLKDLLVRLTERPADWGPEVDSSEFYAVIEQLSTTLAAHPEHIDALADQLIHQHIDADTNLAWAPLIMAALQVYFTRLVVDHNLATEDATHKAPFGLCPCCGALPIASVVKSTGASAGRRYMTCSLCATEWHIVRVTCSHCESTEKIQYFSLEQGNEAIRAEACGRCNNYRKIFYQEKDAQVEALADDLNSIELDMLMGQEGFYRINDNPFLWLPRE